MDFGESLASAVLDSVASLVIVLDREARIVRCNAACERAMGYTTAEVRGRAVWDVFVVPEEVEAVRAAFASLLASGGPIQHENHWRTRDGEIRRILWSDAPLLDARGEVGFLVGTGTDVTERRWVEEDLLRSSGERQRAQEALELREQQLRLITDSVPALISYVDAGERYRFLNRQYEIWFGGSREGVYGRTVREVVGDAAYAEIRGHVAAALAGQPLSYEAWIPYRSGKRFVHGDYVPDRDQGGAVRGFFALVADITDRKQAEEELRAARDAFAAASHAKDRFLAILSHELRTPLTPVLAAASSLEADPALRRDVRERLAMIRRNVELEARLIDDLLDLTRISRGKLELHPQWVDAREILNHAIQICCAGELAAGRIRLEVALAPGDYRVWADGPRLMQVFWNLLNNAVKFTPAGGAIAVRSRVEQHDGEKRLQVEVEDTGIGIEPETLPRVFEAFEQVDRRITRRFGGLGLGLAVSKAILELHGGSLAAASAGRERGATFTVQLPSGREPGDLDDTPVEPAVPVPEPRPAGRRLRLLLVEDHADTAQAMADLLSLLGHQVTTAGSLAGGLAAAAAAQAAGGFDLLVSDLGLPDGSGLDLMRELARRYGLQGIALSGYGMDEDLRRSREAGFARHLTKPVTLQTLKDAIEQTAGRGAVGGA